MSRKFAWLTSIFLVISGIANSQTSGDSLSNTPPLFLQQADHAFDAGTILSLPCLNTPDSVYIQRLQALPYSVDLSYNADVKYFIELYTNKIKAKFGVILGLSEFYFPIMDSIFNHYHIPTELKYLAVVESALNPMAVSRAHAVGLWQFMKGTGAGNGLTINSFVDERRGIRESTKAAALYLTKLYGMFGDWYLTLAAYNCGPGNVSRAIARSGGKNNFWDIYKYLPRDTRIYIPQFIGAAYTLNYYREHDIQPVTGALPLNMDTVMVRRRVNLKNVSSLAGIELSVLRMLNPQYIRDVVPASPARKYILNLPADRKEQFLAVSDAIYASYRVSDDARSPGYPDEIIRTDKNGKQYYMHSVRNGENLWVLARKYDTSVTNIKKWNHMNSDLIRQGQKLMIYSD